MTKNHSDVRAGEILLEDLDDTSLVRMGAEVQSYSCSTRWLALLWFTLFWMFVGAALLLPVLIVYKL